ncbi:MSH2 protein [Massospora cicadina]|nr:MSH2 protein [Massospora cicadina]
MSSPTRESSGLNQETLSEPYDLAGERTSDQSFAQFFNSLPEKPSDTIRLFERAGGDSYTVHGEDAYSVAKLVFKTTTVVKFLGGDVTHGLATCTLARAIALSFMRDQVPSKRLEIWGDGDKSKRIKYAEAPSQASPGNVQALEDILFQSVDLTVAPVVLAVKISTTNDRKLVGASFINPSTQIIGVAEFIDNEIFSNFESLVVQTGAMECLLPKSTDKDYDLQKLYQVVLRCGVMATPISRASLDAGGVDRDLDNLVTSDLVTQVRPEFGLKLAMGAAAGVIKYLRLMEDDVNLNRFTLVKHDLTQYMRLDGSAVRALSLTNEPGKGGRAMSLFGLLNCCQTSQGSRLLSQWLKQPLTRAAEINERLDLVSAFVDDEALRQDLRGMHLKGIPDMHRLAKRFRKASASIQDIIRVYQVILKLPDLISALEGSRHADLLERVYTAKLKEYYAGLFKLRELTETTVDLEKADRHEYVLNPTFEPYLQELHVQLQRIESSFAPEHERMGRLLNMPLEKKLKLEKSSVHGYCFRLTRTEATCLRAHDNAIIELSTQKGGVYFTSKAMNRLNEKYQELSAEYAHAQASSIKEIIKIFETYTHLFELLNALIAHLDLLLSFAHVAVSSATPYVRPTLSSGQKCLNLKAARHPCLEVQPTINFIPNDVRMVQGKREFLIITGPNMGGKSTYIRQVGVIALMAQMGSFVPCSQATLPIFDCILARVGANDSPLKGISTFMAEMLETATIVKSATPHSLIIVDELGRGTSTNDGFGLAWAISNHIATKLGSFCLFATHFHELTKLSEQVPTVANLHAVAHMPQDDPTGEIVLVYQIQEGVCDQSFGTHVARMAGFPSFVVGLAKRKVEELERIETCQMSKVSKLQVPTLQEACQFMREATSCLVSNSASQATSLREHAMVLSENFLDLPFPAGFKPD